MLKFGLSLAALVAILLIPTAASAQVSGSIDRAEPYESRDSSLVYLRVTATGQSAGSTSITLYSLPASTPCSAIAGLTGPGSRSRAYVWSESGSGALTLQKEDAVLEREDGPQQRLCLLDRRDAVLAERVVDISSFARLSEKDAKRWLRNTITCDDDERCPKIRNLSMRCKRRTTSEFRCFARWRAKNKRTGSERVTWLHHRFRISAALDDDAGVSARGKYRVGKGNGRP